MGDRIKSHRDLIVWQKAMELVESIYDETRVFAKDELYGLTSQMRRAAVSIPANIAESQGRRQKGEFRRFLGECERIITGARHARGVSVAAKVS